MSESGASAEFRRPQGEEHVSSSEAALAANSFRQMTTDLYNSTGKTRDGMIRNLSERNLKLKIGRDMYASLYKQTDMNIGHVSEKVEFYEAGKAENEWGPKICSYVTGSGIPKVSRYDYPNVEEREMMGATPLTDENAGEILKGTLEAVNMSLAMGLNGGAVGVEEVNDIRELLSAGTPLSYDEGTQ